MGVTLSDQATIEEIRQKEKEYLEKRELIATSLESVTRSATSLVYQINKKYLQRLSLEFQNESQKLEKIHTIK